VGRAFLRVLIAKEAELRRRYDVRWRLTGVATRRSGWLADPHGLNPIALLNGHWPSQRDRAPNDIREWLERSHADVFIEASSLNLQGPIVYAFAELTKLAVEKQKKFLYESTVMDGVPIFSMFPLGLPAVDLRGFHGVLNSTTNVVLTEIERGLSFDEAVKRAQAMGIAETDPSADVDGWDAAFKVVALAIVLMGVPVKVEQVRRTGIRELSEEKIRSVRDAGMRYKLVCRAVRRGVGAECTVAPELLLAGDPLANLEGSSSAIRFDMDVFGLSIVEHNPGVDATGYGLVADLVRAVQP
jgi:homoserine dehydrogenase